MDFHDEYAMRKKRWLDFLASESKPGIMFVCQYPGSALELEFDMLRPGKVRERIDYGVRIYERQLEKMRVVEDDSLPHLHPLSGTEIFAEAFGCPVHYPVDNMPFALPLIHNVAEVSKVKVPGLFSTRLSEYFEIAEGLRSRCGKDVLLRLPDIQSPMGIAALIWEKEDFLASLILEPEAVMEVAGKVYELLCSFLDEWFSRYGIEYVAHYPEYPMRGGVTLSEDEIGSVSPAVFRDLFRPWLVKLSERYGGLGIHCCANSRHQWENFKELPDLRLINLCRPSGTLLESLAFFADKCVQMPGGLKLSGGVESWVGQIPWNARCALIVEADDGKDAVEKARVLGQLRRLC